MKENSGLKSRTKKIILSLIAGVTLLGVGVSGGTMALNAGSQQTVVKAKTYPASIFYANIKVGGTYRRIEYVNMITPVVGKTYTMKVPTIKGYTPNRKTIHLKIEKYKSSPTGIAGERLEDLYYTRNGSVSVKYTAQKLTKQVKLAPGHNFYNHIPGSNYTVKLKHYGTTYKGKTVTIDNSGIKKGMKTPYYRCCYKGKLIGWIYTSALVNPAKYTTVKKTATVIASPKNNFYNHLTYSVYATKLWHYGKTYKNRKVTINKQAVRVGTKTPYYRCYIGNKEIGWIYGGALTNIQ
ncbi:GW dipeptide domain-containing protein [Pediococcus siamensis]|uniref:GW dipeptide domain-containing protein n=1 Tax=Pediococcus siamensis TaxID=381829 RepID=UPI00399F3997